MRLSSSFYEFVFIGVYSWLMLLALEIGRA